MNTHDKIELPPLPPADRYIEFDSHRMKASIDIPYWGEKSLESYARAAVEADRKNTAELLKNPVHVHTNMCRGIIAPITFDQLAHVLGDEATKAWISDRKRRDISNATQAGNMQSTEPVKRKRPYAQGTALGEFGVIPMCDQVDDEPVKFHPEVGKNAKKRFESAMKGSKETDPIERLRFYCSLAMSGQDWLDAEPFFDALVADRQSRGEPVAWRWSESNGERWFDWTTDWSYHDRAAKMGCLIEYAAPSAPQPTESVSKTDWNNELSSWSDEDFICIFHECPDLANRLRKILAEPVKVPNMTTKSDTERERAEFEAWYLENNDVPHEAIKRKGAGYDWIGTDEAWETWQAAQAALQSQYLEDAERYRWLTEDHADAETRTRCREILDRMAVMSYSSACDAIDHARRIEGG